MSRCQAICCNTGHGLRGKQCPEQGEMRADGRIRCWVHESAAANRGRREPMRYVALGQDLAPILAQSVRRLGGEA